MKKNTWNTVSRFTHETESTGLLFWQAYSIWRRAIENALQEYDITHIQFVLLASLLYLDEKKITTSQNDLAQFTQCDITMTSQVLRTLEKKGLIKRSYQKGNERTKFSTITQKGKTLVTNALQAVENIDAKFFGQLNDQQDIFKHCLMKLQT